MKLLVPKDIKIVFEERQVVIENNPVNLSRIVTFDRVWLDDKGDTVPSSSKPIEHQGVNNRAQPTEGQKHSLSGYPAIVFYSDSSKDSNGMVPALTLVYLSEADRDNEFNDIIKSLKDDKKKD